MPRQAGLGAGGPRSPALYVPGDRRRMRVPDEALAVAGGPCGGNVPWGAFMFPERTRE